MHFDLINAYCGTDLEIIEMAASREYSGARITVSNQCIFIFLGAIPLIKQDLYSTKGAMSNSLSGMYDMHSI